MAMTVKDLWVVIERELKEIKQTFAEFKNNDFLHLELKVDKLSQKVYIGIGAVILMQIIIGILVQVIF
jgi:hypothetical protein